MILIYLGDSSGFGLSGLGREFFCIYRRYHDMLIYPEVSGSNFMNIEFRRLFVQLRSK
jgi:hypothetical protein